MASGLIVLLVLVATLALWRLSRPALDRQAPSKWLRWFLVVALLLLAAWLSWLLIMVLLVGPHLQAL